MIFVSSFLLIFLAFQTLSAQTQNSWKGEKSCTVCLTYDDGMDVHLDNAIPQLDQFGLKGTFYLTGSSLSLDLRLEDWRKAAENGHELGNHTLFHPCNGLSKGRDWVSKEHDLDLYSMDRFLEEVQVANIMLKAIDGKDTRTFAYPCGDMFIEGENLIGYLPEFVRGARSTTELFQSQNDIDVYNLSAFSCTGKTAKEMIALVKEAKQKNSLLVFLFHGVGGGYLSVDNSEHEKLLQYLSENQEEIWVAPAIDVVKYLRGE
jgi:sialate O-acetylesterase